MVTAYKVSREEALAYHCKDFSIIFEREYRGFSDWDIRVVRPDGSIIESTTCQDIEAKSVRDQLILKTLISLDV